MAPSASCLRNRIGRCAPPPRAVFIPPMTMKPSWMGHPNTRGQVVGGHSKGLSGWPETKKSAKGHKFVSLCKCISVPIPELLASNRCRGLLDKLCDSLRILKHCEMAGWQCDRCGLYPLRHPLLQVSNEISTLRADLFGQRVSGAYVRSFLVRPGL